MNSKHAYLIYTHNNFRVLEKLLRSLDDERNDIYLHIDKKVKEFNAIVEKLKTIVIRASLYILENRTDVRWGEVSQIKAELALYREASNREKYHYYHLLSGVDMPLRSQNEIHAFFDKRQDEEFITFMPYSCSPIDRVRYLTLFPICRREWTTRGAIMRIANKWSYKIQKAIRFNYTKHYKDTLRWGSNWCSLTDDAVRYILNYMDKNIKWYRFSKNGDEIYKQTILYNSAFKDKISDLGYLRVVDWDRAKPYTFTKEDYNLLINSENSFFARKFDETIDFDIVEMLYKTLID